MLTINAVKTDKYMSTMRLVDIDHKGYYKYISFEGTRNNVVIWINGLAYATTASAMDILNRGLPNGLAYQKMKEIIDINNLDHNGGPYFFLYKHIGDKLALFLMGYNTGSILEGRTSMFFCKMGVPPGRHRNAIVYNSNNDEYFFLNSSINGLVSSMLYLVHNTFEFNNSLDNSITINGVYYLLKIAQIINDYEDVPLPGSSATMDFFINREVGTPVKYKELVDDNLVVKYLYPIVYNYESVIDEDDPINSVRLTDIVKDPELLSLAEEAELVNVDDPRVQDYTKNWGKLVEMYVEDGKIVAVYQAQSRHRDVIEANVLNCIRPITNFKLIIEEAAVC